MPLSFANDSTGLLASVNGEPVTLKLYEASVNLRLASNKFLHGNAAPSDKAIRRARTQSSALLIRRTLVIQELKRRGRYPSKKEIDKHLMAKFNRFGGEKKMRVFTKENSIPWDHYIQLLTDTYVANTFPDLFPEDEVMISEDKLINYYNQNLNKYRPSGEGRLTIVTFTPKKELGSFDLETMVRDMALSDSWESLRPKLDKFNIRYGNLVRRKIMRNLKIHEDEENPIWSLPRKAGVGKPVFYKEDNNLSFYIYMLESTDIPVKMSFEEAEDEIRDLLIQDQIRKKVRKEIETLHDRATIEFYAPHK